MFTIYLPNDTEKWFNIVFSRESRAFWFAEQNKLEPDDYEIRSINQPVINIFNNTIKEKAVA